LAVDANGDVIVAGSSFGNSSGADYATIKYSNAGTPLWTNRYNGPANDRDGAEALAVDKDGSVFVTGYSVGNGSQEDYATIKYSSGGVPLWTNRYNGPGNFLDGANALALDASGDVFVTGGSQDGTGPLSDVFIDYATIKYSSTGVPLWTNRYNGPGNNHDTATALAVDASGDVFVTGRSTGPGIVNEPSPYNYAPYLDYATIKYSNAGVPLWTNRYDGPGNNQDEAGALALDTGGNVFVTGASPSTSNYGSQDYATIKYSNTGVPLWTNRHNGLANKLDQANSLAVGPDGSVYVTGGSEKNPSGGGQYFEFATIKIVSVPLLAIQRSAADVIVSWPATFTNYSLQQDIAGIGTANWSNITATVQNDGTNQTLIVSPPTGNRFYRLFKP
jgi:hypothetical protein